MDKKITIKTKADLWKYETSLPYTFKMTKKTWLEHHKKHRKLYFSILKKKYNSLKIKIKFEEWVNKRSFNGKSFLGYLARVFESYDYELRRHYYNKKFNRNYDVYTFGVGPRGRCKHENANCSFEMGHDCECPSCGASW